MKIRKFSLGYFILVSAVLLTACNSDEINIGGYLLDSTIRTVVIDTCSVELSSVAIDSVVTSGQDCALIGSFADTTFGSITCTAFVPFTAPGSPSLPEHANPVYDSLELLMYINGTWLGDTTSYTSFSVHLLDDEIDLPDDGDYYSNWSESYGSEPIGVGSFKPYPNKTDTISIRLSDLIGEDLFEKIIDDDDATLGTQERFMKYFPGIAVTAGPENNIIMGVPVGDTSMILRVHYHYSLLERTEATITVSPYTDRCYYGVQTDRTGTPFAGLKGNELSSDETGDMVLVQALTGSYVRISFPYLNTLLQLGDFSAITSAYLIIYPVRGTYSADEVPLPEDLSLYISNENDVTTGYITTYSGDELQTGDLTEDELYNIDTYYSYDITSFLQDQLGAFGIYKRTLQLIVPESSQAVTLNTLVAGDASHWRNKMKIKISYLIYDY